MQIQGAQNERAIGVGRGPDERRGLDISRTALYQYTFNGRGWGAVTVATAVAPRGLNHIRDFCRILVRINPSAGL
jgi:hypothetical protein